MLEILFNIYDFLFNLDKYEMIQYILYPISYIGFKISYIVYYISEMINMMIAISSDACYQILSCAHV